MITSLADNSAKPIPIVVIGSSTGGPRILPELFARLPPLRAAIVVVDTLAKVSPMPVQMVHDQDTLQPGRIYIAPSGKHCAFVRNRILELRDDKPVNFVCPSIDVAMLSLCPPQPMTKIVGVVLTGMGADGAAGLVHIKRLGGATFAQDKATCAVFGMPGEAIKTGKVDHVLPPDAISQMLGQMLGIHAAP
jgi:two-component system chemotaxis response regulator CheB